MDGESPHSVPDVIDRPVADVGKRGRQLCRVGDSLAKATARGRLGRVAGTGAELAASVIVLADGVSTGIGLACSRLPGCGERSCWAGTV